MLDPLPFLEFHSLGMDCFGHPLFVYGKGGRPARNGVQEEGLQILHVYSGTLGLYLRFVTPYVIRKPLGGRFESVRITVYLHPPSKLLEIFVIEFFCRHCFLWDHVLQLYWGRGLWSEGLHGGPRSVGRLP